MSVPGPKPTPTKLRVLRGETRPSRLNRNEPAPRASKPSCPKELPAEAKKVWRATCAELEAMGLLSKAYGPVLNVFASAVYEHGRSSAILAQGGILIRGQNGGLVKNPAATVVVQQANLVIKAAAELGLTPSALSRIQRPDAGDGEIARRYFG